MFHVVDGDSLRRNGRDYRLKGIDAPELDQACKGKIGWSYNCGRDAKAALGRLVDGSRLNCQPRDIDRYGRTLAYCRVDDLDINGEMVRLGWAVAYSRLGFTYWRLESEARKAKRGLWQGTFETPDKWRERNRDSLVRGDLGE